MTTRLLPSAMVLSLSLLTSQAMHAASPAPATHETVAASAKVKMISFHIRNASATALTVQAGDQQITIAPGETASMKVGRGTQVTTVNETAHLPAGSVLTTVTEYLQGNTLAVS